MTKSLFDRLEWKNSELTAENIKILEEKDFLEIDDKAKTWLKKNLDISLHEVFESNNKQKENNKNIDKKTDVENLMKQFDKDFTLMKINNKREYKAKSLNQKSVIKIKTESRDSNILNKSSFFF